MISKFKRSLCLLLALSAWGCSASTENAEESTQAETDKQSQNTAQLAGIWYSTEAEGQFDLNLDGSVTNLSIDDSEALTWKAEAGGNILFSLNDGLYASLKPTDSKESALHNSNYYYLNDGLLILNRREYSQDPNAMQAAAAQAESKNDNTESVYDTSWKSDDGKSVTFSADGSISGTLEIDDDEVDSYYVNPDKSITFTMALKGGSEPYLLVYKTDNQSQAESDDAYYYISDKVLILDQKEYSR